MENKTQQLTKQERRELRQEEKEIARSSVQKQRTRRRIATWTVVILGLSVLIFGLSKIGGNYTEGSRLNDPVDELDWIKGNQDAAVSLVEYADFQCPACGAYYPLIKQLSEEYGDRVAFVYRHFPLRRIHSNANLAAQASEAAGIQNKFWEMHDMIYEGQDTWSRHTNPRDIFISYAQTLALDLDKFEEDLNSSEVKDRVDKGLNSATHNGLNATPTFFINNEKIINNPQNIAEFRSLLQEVFEPEQSE